MRKCGACLLVFSLIFAQPARVWAEEDSNHLERARRDAEEAKVDAQKAIDKAEKAIAEAEAAISQAEKAKAKAKEQKAKAMEKMITAGNYPEDFTITAPDGASTAVFSHKKHTEREELRCIECHPKVFIMKAGKDVYKKGQLTMAQMKKGKYCGNCHDGQKAFSVSSVRHCRKCHSK